MSTVKKILGWLLMVWAGLNGLRLVILMFTGGVFRGTPMIIMAGLFYLGLWLAGFVSKKKPDISPTSD